MLDLAVSLTPPKPGSKESTMSPNLYIASTPALTSIKRKASLPEISPSQAKRFRLESLPTADETTVTKYQERVDQTCDRSSLMVMIPFEQTWGRTLERIKNLEEEVSELSKEVSELSKKATELSNEASEQVSELSELSK